MFEELGYRHEMYYSVSRETQWTIQ